MQTQANSKTHGEELLQKLDAYWRAANYLSVGQIYLYDNPLLKRPLTLGDLKHMLLGHWGTTPGQNFIYAHLNRAIKKYDLDMIYVSGPGHGGPAVVSNTYLEGTYSEIYPDIRQDEAGLRKLFIQFSFPGGIPSHASPECPGSIHEGGELGYSLSHSFGAVFDNPGLVVACVIGAVGRKDVTDMPSLLSRLYLMRHGETAWSLSGQHTGRTDIPLTEQGEQDARKLAERLRAVEFSRVLTSPLQRARRTCELAGLGKVAEIEPDLVEWEYGDYEGQRPADIREARPGWNVFRDGCPGGESPAQVSERADRLIAQLRTLEGDIAIFSHGHFGRVLAARWIGLQIRQAQHLLLSTASVSILGYEHNRVEAPAIVLWNAVSKEFLT